MVISSLLTTPPLLILATARSIRTLLECFSLTLLSMILLVLARYDRARANGSFPPMAMDSDSDSDSKPYHYIVLCTTFSTGSDSDLDPCMDSFPNGYCTHFRVISVPGI